MKYSPRESGAQNGCSASNLPRVICDATASAMRRVKICNTPSTSATHARL